MPSRPISRRRFFQHAAAVSALAIAPVGRLAAQVRFNSYPFKLGVASGDPTADGFVLWTRLAPEPFEPEQLGEVNFEVTWEVATDPSFSRIVAHGVALALPSLVHAVHVEVGGLGPATEYFYRFRLGRYESPVGRALTAPAADAAVQSVRYVTCSCAHYERGFFAAYRYMADDRPDLIIELGDYIYDVGYGDHRVRVFDKQQAVTLTDYRHRYAQYRLDPDLQAAHAVCPWLVTWDDHDVSNDYAGLTSQNDACGGEAVHAAFAAQRAAAYQAWFEHMPVRPSRLRPHAAVQVYSALDWGRLARFYLLDTRQYRTPQACPVPPTWETCDEIHHGRLLTMGQNGKIQFIGTGGGQLIPTTDPACKAQLDDPARTMLGPDQEAWFDGALAASRATWNLISLGTPFTTIWEGTPKAPEVYSDAWGGYPLAQRRFLQALKRNKVVNPVLYTGDLHAFVAEETPGLDDKPAAVEIVATAIANSSADKSKVLHLNPQIKYYNGKHSGYVRCETTPSTTRVDLVGIDDMHDPRTPRRVLASYDIDSGSPTLHRRDT